MPEKPQLVRKPPSTLYYQDGPPEAVDMDRWRLIVAGPGLEPLSLSYMDFQDLPQVDQNRRMVCVCNWSIRQTWSGVLLETVLEMASWKPGPRHNYLRQTSIGTPAKGTYTSTIPVQGALSREALLVMRIDGAPLSLERGFPIRLMDFGLYGYKGVKGLNRLDLTDTLELGHWEAFAGYDVHGTIKPKRYRACDLDRMTFATSPGEITHE